jgi:hypothetical protein
MLLYFIEPSLASKFARQNEARMKGADYKPGETGVNYNANVEIEPLVNVVGRIMFRSGGLVNLEIVASHKTGLVAQGDCWRNIPISLTDLVSRRTNGASW